MRGTRQPDLCIDFCDEIQEGGRTFMLIPLSGRETSAAGLLFVFASLCRQVYHGNMLLPDRTLAGDSNKNTSTRWRHGVGGVGGRICTSFVSFFVPRCNVTVIVGGSAIALLWLLSSDLRATQCGAPSKPQPTTWNGRSGIWRHNYSVRMACPTAKTTRIKLTRPSPRLVYH